MRTTSAVLATLVVAVAAQDTGLPNYLAGLSEQANFALNPALVRGNELGVPSFKKNTPGLPEYLEDGKCADVGVQPDFDYEQVGKFR